MDILQEVHNRIGDLLMSGRSPFELLLNYEDFLRLEKLTTIKGIRSIYVQNINLNINVINFVESHILCNYPLSYFSLKTGERVENKKIKLLQNLI